MVLKYYSASAGDSAFLSEMARVSKRFWGYDDAMMTLWKPELEISKEYIHHHHVVKVFDQNEFVGFFAVIQRTKDTAEIDHLWLVPNKVRQGYGREILRHITQELNAKGVKTAVVIAEPHAKGFYEKTGAKIIDRIQSGADDRYLDVYEYKLN